MGNVTLVSLAKLEVLFNRQKPSPCAALVGAKVGANVHSHQATPGDVQPPLLLVNATLATWGYVRRPGGADLGAGGFTSLALDPTNSSIVYAAGGGEIFKSTDFGGTWTLSGLPSSVSAPIPAA